METARRKHNRYLSMRLNLKYRIKYIYHHSLTSDTRVRCSVSANVAGYLRGVLFYIFCNTFLRNRKYSVSGLW